mgnify:CR=1 FL=1|tara:strand:- start:303 stop:581 length:279 start_codon:yes stop_codon:yes gene_type:complete
MTIKINKTNKKSNVIQFTKYINKKKNTLVSSTIAAIIAVKIDHPENIEPEDYLIDKIELDDSIEILAFEDAIDNVSENSNNLKNTNNFVNDA